MGRHAPRVLHAADITSPVSEVQRERKVIPLFAVLGPVASTKIQVTPYDDHVGSFLRAPWLAKHHQLYSGGINYTQNPHCPKMEEDAPPRSFSSEQADSTFESNWRAISGLNRVGSRADRGDCRADCARCAVEGEGRGQGGGVLRPD